MSRNVHDNDIKKYPGIVSQATDANRVTLGDMHGNSLLMLYFLVRHGVLRLKNSERDYQLFVKLYDEFLSIFTSSLFLPEDKFNSIIQSIDPDADPTIDPAVIPAADPFRGKMQNPASFYNFCYALHAAKIYMQQNLAPFDVNHQPFQFRLEKIVAKYSSRIQNIIKAIENIINTATVTDTSCTVRFIGDMLADRGACDLFTLQMLNKLNDNAQVKVVILASNHDYLLLRNWVFEKNLDFKGVRIGMLQGFSMQTLCALMKQGLITENDTDALVKNAYLPRLKLADYSTEQILTPHGEKMRIYLHAPYWTLDKHQVTKQHFLYFLPLPQ